MTNVCTQTAIVFKDGSINILLDDEHDDVTVPVAINRVLKVP